jgi:hypothetical protein
VRRLPARFEAALSGHDDVRVIVPELGRRYAFTG